jgi:hypothetical protein
MTLSVWLDAPYPWGICRVLLISVSHCGWGYSPAALARLPRHGGVVHGAFFVVVCDQSSSPRRRLGAVTAVLALLATAVVSVAQVPVASATASAVVAGFDSTTFTGNDDLSQAVTMPFTIDFFGSSYSSMYLNNNGNLTFGQPLGTYTPYPLSETGLPMIAAFFADVDTRTGSTASYGTGTVDGNSAWGATWPNVGCYNEITSVLNNFQLLLIDRSDIAVGDFDIEFNYDQIQWETGTASGGSPTCQGGTSARAGYAAGSGGTGTYYELPGSGVNGAFLDGNTATGLTQPSVDNTVEEHQSRSSGAPTSSLTSRTQRTASSSALHSASVLSSASERRTPGSRSYPAWRARPPAECGRP